MAAEFIQNFYQNFDRKSYGFTYWNFFVFTNLEHFLEHFSGRSNSLYVFQKLKKYKWKGTKISIAIWAFHDIFSQIPKPKIKNFLDFLNRIKLGWRRQNDNKYEIKDKNCWLVFKKSWKFGIRDWEICETHVVSSS